MIRLALVVLALIASNARADEFDEGFEAFKRQDYVSAVRIYRPLAERGHLAAQSNLGLMYRLGMGVPQDYSEAIKWLRLASVGRQSAAQYYLGAMYAQGEGVAQDYVKAHMWLNTSAARGLQAAGKERDIVASKMTRQQIAEAQKLARECQARNFNNCD